MTSHGGGTTPRKDRQARWSRAMFAFKAQGVDVCLPAARAEIARGDDIQPLRCLCEDPPPRARSADDDRMDLVWVEGECDGVRIAARAAAQTGDGGKHPPVRRLCGSVPVEFEPWGPAGRVYAVASGNGCQY